LVADHRPAHFKKKGKKDRGLDRHDMYGDIPGCCAYPVSGLNYLSLRVEFLLKTESGYLRDAEVT